VFPSENNKVVVEVRSNVIAIEPAVDSKNTDPSKTGSGFAWPRSWDNNEADDRLAIRSWARFVEFFCKLEGYCSAEPL